MKKPVAIACVALLASFGAGAQTQYSYSIGIQAPHGTQIYVDRRHWGPPAHMHGYQNHHRPVYPQWGTHHPHGYPYRHPGAVPTFAPTGCNTYWNVQVGAWMPCR